mgnify:CR=1 FL=1
MHNSLQFVDDINRQLIRFGDKTIGEIALDLDINLMAGKGASSNVLRKIIHKITMDRPFGGIDKRQSLKIIPVDSNTTKCFESLSFRAIEIKQVLNSDFVNSSVMDEIQKHLLEKAQNAINEVAEENNYTYIFDISLGSIVYGKESKDIMPLVKTKLGIE